MEAQQLEGKRVPKVILKTRAHGANGDFEWKEVVSKDLFKKKNVVIFGLPGAFTPTCSSTHLPGYENSYDELKNLGVDEVYCISVNDAFVMNAWGKTQNISKVKLLPDGSGLFTKKLGLLVKKDNVGFGKRSWRYSLYVENGVIRKAFIEPGFSDDCPTDPFEVSDVNTMVNYLKSK